MSLAHGPATELETLIRKARQATQRRLHSWVSKGIKALSYRSGLTPAVERLRSFGAVVLFYHKVQRRSVGLWGEPVLGVEQFEQHLRFLTRHYELVPLSRIVSSIKSGASLPERAVAVTFDDGYRNNLLLAAPLLKHHAVPATFFLSTGLVGTNRWMWAYELEELFLRYPSTTVAKVAADPVLEGLCQRELSREVLLTAWIAHLKGLSTPELERVLQRLRTALPVEVDDENRFLAWDDARALSSMGFELGGHTVNHPILVRMGLPEASEEVIGCGRDLSERLGVRPTLFAYPNGDTSPQVSSLVGRHFDAAFTTTPGGCSRGSNILELPRVCAPVEVAELSFELTRHFVRPPPEPLAVEPNLLRTDDAVVRAALSPTPAAKEPKPEAPSEAAPERECNP